MKQPLPGFVPPDGFDINPDGIDLIGHLEKDCQKLPVQAAYLDKNGQLWLVAEVDGQKLVNVFDPTE
jgi:hypothetical protein